VAGYIPRRFTCQQAVTYPGSNRLVSFFLNQGVHTYTGRKKQRYREREKHTWLLVQLIIMFIACHGVSLATLTSYVAFTLR